MDMKPYTQPIPTAIQEISVVLKSVLKPVYDEETNEPTGATTVEQSLDAYAVILDQDGNETWHPSAQAAQLLSNGFITQAQLDALINWGTDFRTKLEQEMLP